MYKFIFIILGICLFLPGNVLANEINSIADLGIEEGIIKEDKNYFAPSSILVFPILPKDTNYDIDSQTWIKAIYYYTIQRLGFNDIPIHYLVTSSGVIYKGNSGGDERQIAVEGTSSDVILVGYLAESKKNTFSAAAESALQNLLLKLCNENSIRPENINTGGISFVRNSETRSVKITKNEVFGLWQQSINNIVINVSQSYSPSGKAYSLEIPGLVLPEGEVEPTEEVSATISLKNTGTNGIYAGTASEILLSKASSGESVFFLNKVWASQSQIYLLNENQKLLPGEETTVTFKMRAPLYVGEVSEEFEVKTVGGTKVQSNNVGLKLNIKRTSKQIVEIKNTEAGYANARAQPWTGSEILTQVSAGQRFFLMEQNDETLWARIDLGGGQSGWLAVWFLNYL